jgi:hypothetical protein
MNMQDAGVGGAWWAGGGAKEMKKKIHSICYRSSPVLDREQTAVQETPLIQAHEANKLSN